MTDVWDFERDLYPFNLERARDEFDAFWPANNLVASNDFNVPTFADYREPGDPPLSAEEGYTRRGKKFWSYRFPWQTSTQSKSTYYFNQDIALEQINMTIIKENSRLMDYLAEYGCEMIATDTIMPRLDSAMRDDFDRSMRYRFRHSWRCRNRHDCDTLTPPETTLTYLNDELERLMRIQNRTLERAHTWMSTRRSGARDRSVHVPDWRSRRHRLVHRRPGGFQRRSPRAGSGRV